jgi:DNA invertase Pin-like site-specific DNA recombinase
MIRERTKLGLARARLEGRVGGNRAALTPKQQAHALEMIDAGKSQSEVAEVFRYTEARYVGWSANVEFCSSVSSLGRHRQRRRFRRPRV